MTRKNAQPKPALTERLLRAIEKAGNRLPHPTLLFMWLALAVVVLSWLLARLEFSALHPVTGQTQSVVSLASAAGLQRMLGEAVTNFTGFAPVGVVLVTMLGMGIAEHSGLLSCLLQRIVRNTRPALLAYVVAFAGVLSSLGADVGYVVLIPLAALLYHENGRSPLAGIAVAFAGVSAGFSANLLLGPVDVMLAAISTEAAQLVEPTAIVEPADNYYFIIASTLLITVVAGTISNRLIEPRLARITGNPEATPGNDGQSFITQAAVPRARPADGLSLRSVGVFTLAYAAAIAALSWPDTGVQPQDSQSFLLANVVPLLALYFGLAGYIFGRSNGKYQSAEQAVEGMENAMSTMAYYIVLMFFAAQFVSYFAWSNIGSVLAISGAAALSGLQGYPVLLLLGIILLSGLVNLFVGSASAKWTLLAPVFVPMLLLLGVPAEQTQMAYRIGDSSTNIITPLMPYFGIVLAYAQRYQKTLGLGDIIAMMLPFSVALLIAWSALIVTWVSFSLPFGP